MRYATTLLVLLLVAGCAGSKVAGQRDAPMGTRTIIVETDMDAEAAYEHAAQVLQDQGYVLAETDSQLGTITTEPRRLETFDAPRIRISANVQGESPATIELRASSAGGTVVRKATDQRSAWLGFHSLAEAFDGQLRYEGG